MSDGIAYLNCLFVPKYNCTTTDTGILLRDEKHINKFDLVSLDDYETKSVPGISKMTLSIKKITLKQRMGHKIGRPEELVEYIENEGIQCEDPSSTVKLEEITGPVPAKSNMERLYESSRTISELLSGKQGILLVRVTKKKMKVQRKETGVFSILVFHVVDKAGESIKCEMMGGDALRNDKKIRPRCIYEFSGMELTFNNYINGHIMKFGKEY